jgi:hypothetical protein
MQIFRLYSGSDGHSRLSNRRATGFSPCSELRSRTRIIRNAQYTLQSQCAALSVVVPECLPSSSPRYKARGAR